MDILNIGSEQSIRFSHPPYTPLEIAPSSRQSVAPAPRKMQPAKEASCHTSLPPDLLILNRFGIGYPYLIASWKLAQRYNMSVMQVLIRAGVISEDIWLAAQELLAEERSSARQQHLHRSFLLQQAVNHLHDTQPEFSSRHTFTLKQVFIVGSSVLFFLLLGQTLSALSSLIMVLFFSCFYLANILLRTAVLARYSQPSLNRAIEIFPPASSFPVYTVLIALYREAGQIEELCEHVLNLRWPRDKLDVKLICEADDAETIRAIMEADLPDVFELVVVPKADPRTKPKALNFALPLALGDFLVLYDAEDRPHPDQLLEAWARFKSCSADVACLQSPLHIHNGNQSWLSRMFFIEYLTLFNGILPALAKWKLPIPLGGTSNHFRTELLRDIGGWDPYNVTEDADLGIRLFRKGYRCETLVLPTYEEAPPNFDPWLKQRTRWMKGWMQTILVHTRNHRKMTREIGFRGMFTFHLLLTSIVISALIHPIFMVSAIIHIAKLPGETMTGFEGIILATCIFNLVGAYTTHALLSYAVLRNFEGRRHAAFLFSLPYYWLLMSLAGWRALLHLFFKPHTWEKTPHGLAKADFCLSNVARNGKPR